MDPNMYNAVTIQLINWEPKISTFLFHPGYDCVV